MFLWRSFFRFDDFSLLQLGFACTGCLFFIGMAYWSYIYAEKGVDPGYLEFKHFRNNKQLDDKEHREKWEDHEFREMIANLDRW